MSEYLLVKPFGSMKAPLVVVSSYRTNAATSTLHRQYATVNDLSNIYIFYLYSKLNFHQEGIQKSSMLYIGIFLRRIDRRQRALDALPFTLRDYWEEVPMDTFYMSSKVPVVLLSGQSAVDAYIRYVARNKISSTPIPSGKTISRSMRYPLGWLETLRKPDGSNIVFRLVLCVPHPESFIRRRGWTITDDIRTLAISERLIDWVVVRVHGNPHLLGLLSSMTYCTSRETGFIMPIELLKAFRLGQGHDQVRSLFSLPKLKLPVSQWI
jgi:hypothetical protein